MHRGEQQRTKALQVGAIAESPLETQDPKVEEENDP